MCGAVPREPNSRRSSSLTEIVSKIISCTRCPLHATRNRPVPGEGPVPSPLMMVGEAPGAHEDATGRPFVGPAGMLLDKAMREVGLRREDAYITNIVKCRPPGNRVPRFAEVKECIGYLKSQLELVNPKVVIALGSTAATYLLSLNEMGALPMKPRTITISRVRGKVFAKKIGNIAFYLVPTYHPAGVLRKRSLYEELVSDIRLAKEYLTHSEPPNSFSGQSTLPL